VLHLIRSGPVFPMSAAQAQQEPSPPESSHAGAPHSRNPRVLACALCQQRKIKCDRGFPCTNCIRSKVQCVPATLAQRKRRFPERALLERLRKYESLLRENGIKFEPLHKDQTSGDSPNADGRSDVDEDHGQVKAANAGSPSPTIGSGKEHEITGPK
jgi:hypothetical protein